MVGTKLRLFCQKMVLEATYYNTTALKCRSRGYKPETKQVVALATYNLAMERELLELPSIFGLLIGPHVSAVVVASSNVAARYGQTGETSV